MRCDWRFGNLHTLLDFVLAGAVYRTERLLTHFAIAHHVLAHVSPKHAGEQSARICFALTLRHRQPRSGHRSHRQMFITSSAAVAGLVFHRLTDAGGRHEFHSFQCPSFGNAVFSFRASSGSTPGYCARGFPVFARTALPLVVRTQPNVGLGATIFTQAAVLRIVGVAGTSCLGTMGCHQQRIPVIISRSSTSSLIIAVTVADYVRVSF